MKYLSIIKYILLVASAVIVAIGMFTYTPGGSDAGVETMLVWAGILLVLTTVLALAMPLIGISQNPKSAKKSLFGLGILVVILLISYALSSDEPVKLASGEVYENAAGLKFSDTGLYATYIMFACVVLSLVCTEIYKAVKN